MEKLEIHCYDWQEHDQCTIDECLSIYGWGLDKETKPYLIRIEKYRPSLYLEVIDKYVSNDSDFAYFIINMIKKKFMDVTVTWKKKTKLYHFPNKNRYMWYVTFKNLKDLRDFENYFKNDLTFNNYGRKKFAIWEGSESRVSSCVKMLTEVNLNHSQWFEVYGTKITDEKDKVSKLEREYIINYKDIKALDLERTKKWNTKPGILVFDIECYSDNHKHLPDSQVPNHCVTMISCVYQRYMMPETRQRYNILYGDCKDINDYDCQIFRVDNEIEVIYTFCKIIEITDPEIISGFNILSFDYDYLNNRMMLFDLKWPNISRLKMNNCYLKKVSWKSDAYGVNTIANLYMEGRITLDMLPIIKRDFKLPKNSLEYVSRYFLNKGKNDVSPKMMFKIFEDVCIVLNRYYNDKCVENYREVERILEENRKVVLYCIQDSELVIELFEKLDVWIKGIQMSNTTGVTIFKSFSSGQQIRCISLIYKKTYERGIVMDMMLPSPETFKGGFVFEPIPGIYDDVICLDFMSLYPSIIMALNICYHTYVPKNIKIDDNLCHNVVVDSEKLNEEERSMDEIGDTGRIVKIIDGKKISTHRFVKKDVVEGIIPQLVRELVMKRREVKKKLVQYESVGDYGNPEYKNLNALQLSMKVTANSFYGFFKIKNGGILPLLEASESITSKGRTCIEEVFEYVRLKYNAIVLYADTDSCMIKIPGVEGKQCMIWGEKLMDEINGYEIGDKIPGTCDFYKDSKNGLFEKPLAMDFEKAMRMFLVKKKRYAYLSMDENGEFKKIKGKDEYLISYKGLISVRRDNCMAMKTVFNELLYNIITHETFIYSFACILRFIKRLIYDEIPILDFEITKGLNDSYKSETAQMAIFSNILRENGTPATPGDRLGFIVYNNPDAKRTGEKMMLTEQFAELGNKLKIDYDYYITITARPVDQIFEIAYKQECSKLKLYIQKGKYITYPYTPIKFLHVFMMSFKNHKQKKHEFDFKYGITEVLNWLVPMLEKKYDVDLWSFINETK